MNNEQKRSSLWQNWTSVIGGILSVVWFTAIVFLFILDLTSHASNPYLGIFSYFLLPVLLIISLLLIPFGAWVEREQRKKHEYIPRFPRIDFNNPVHQKRAYIIIGVVTLFLLISIVGGYRAYEFTESVTFCGKTCHQVMSPEFTAYQHSPHARVTCVQCHIGPGVGWFVRSKLAGTYQVYSVLFNKYHRPIETPIKNLRPAQETCEKCHWPQQFFGAVEKDRQHFASDKTNSEWKTRMLMYVGGGQPPFGKKNGIHWHMNIKDKVYYIATDKKRQVIPWVKVVSPDGKEQFYIDKESGFTAQNPPKGEMRLMDCMDCHNRPSHIFKSPVAAVEEAMSMNDIDKSLPYIKREAVKALSGKYDTQENAVRTIQESLKDFYQKKYPEVWTAQENDIARSVDAIVKIYQINFFPQMKVSWKEYPSNLGHIEFPGCFRCHDEKHIGSETGKPLTKQCNTCHQIIEQGAPGATEKNTDGLEFKHPFDGDESWKEMGCVDCHSS